VRCVGRVGRRACRGRVQGGRVVAGTVAWSCPSCGDHGDVTGFEGTAHDLSSFVAQGGKLRVWAIDDQERRVLLDATTRNMALRAVVSRASPALEVEQALMIQATLDELDAIYTLVEQLTDATKSRRRIQFLDDVRRGLCGAMDGFRSAYEGAGSDGGGRAPPAARRRSRRSAAMRSGSSSRSRAFGQPLTMSLVTTCRYARGLIRCEMQVPRTVRIVAARSPPTSP
jgi:hypothetical protein